MSNTDPKAEENAAAQTHTPSLAVMIPTRNRPADLEAAVRTLLAQTVLPQELVIVDQSRDDESARRVRELFQQHPAQASRISLCYLHDAQISGLTEARNVALDRNRCAIILFLDDDVELEPEFIENLLKAYAEDEGLTGVSGIITNYKRRGFVDRAWHSIFLHGPFHDTRQALYLRADQLRDAGRIPVTRFTGALMSFRADRIGELRFDGNLRGSAEGEDADFCLRLPPGARLEIEPRARLIHKVTTVARPDEHWIASVVRGNIYLYYRNWRHGIGNRLAFAWVMLGYATLATAASARRLSLEPWRDFVRAAQKAKRLGLGV